MAITRYRGYHRLSRPADVVRDSGLGTGLVQTGLEIFDILTVASGSRITVYAFSTVRRLDSYSVIEAFLRANRSQLPKVMTFVLTHSSNPCRSLNIPYPDFLAPR